MSTLKHVLEIIDLLDDARVNGYIVKDWFISKGLNSKLIDVKRIKDSKGQTDFIKIVIPGLRGKYIGYTNSAPTLGVIGRLGGIGARPTITGMVSDADGAIVALASAYKLLEMSKKGDRILGDVIITTHICPNAPSKSYKPVPMMDTPIDIFKLLKLEVDSRADAILSIDATKANWVIKHTGFAITPTVKEGWILKVSPDLIDIYVRVTGEPPVVVPITMQDILPYSTPVYHINSMMQPWIYTKAPVVGVAITARMAIPGSASGATNVWALEQATRFVVEVAKDFTAGKARFYDEDEWKKIIEIHGNISSIMRRGAP
ncbi:MAG: hypothetical protein B6U85_02670 [Desulfurococcales archaeon ex4484_42]|nr:MAG: hypothetical protein B6U85_02670 [Desulfurococcales archaeon ex4484_42]